MATDRKDTCAGCKWYQAPPQAESPLTGSCRHGAPTGTDQSRGWGPWPHVMAIDWCGDFALPDCPECRLPPGTHTQECLLDPLHCRYVMGSPHQGFTCSDCAFHTEPGRYSEQSLKDQLGLHDDDMARHKCADWPKDGGEDGG